MKPMLMGAMLGAGMGLVQGKDPLKSALIGGATAGIGDKLMGADGLSNLFDVGGSATSNTLNSGAGLISGGGTGATGSFGSMSAFNPTSIVQNVDSSIVPDLMTNSQGFPSAGGYVADVGGYVPNTTDLETAANLKEFGGLTGTPTDTKNIFQQGTDFITNEIDDMSTVDKISGGMQVASLLEPQPEPQMNVPAPQVIQGKPTDPRDGLLAINVPKPFTSFASVEDERRRLFPTSYQG